MRMLRATLLVLAVCGFVACNGDSGGGGSEGEGEGEGPELTWEQCNDGVDNDADGRTDSEDDCSMCPPPGQRGPENASNETCSDGIDNDCNGYIDCVDWSCTRSRPVAEDGSSEITACCPAVVEEGATEQICGDGIDNDCDGSADCRDEDCSPDGQPVQECCPGGPGTEGDDASCSDGEDNDCDGLADCTDNSCRPEDAANICCPAPDERVEEETDATCSDGVDNDCDGYVDCVDRRCWAVFSPAVSVCLAPGFHENDAESCADELDNDGDDLTDCEDPSCQLDLEASECGCSPARPDGVCQEEGTVCADGECREPAMPEVMFSEYIEGSSNNKALEIYNVGAADAELAVCHVAVYSNGAAEPSTEIELGEDALAPGAARVLCHTGAGEVLAPLCDLQHGGLNHNGDDTLALVCRGVVLDVFGRIGERPEGSWTVGEVSSKDATLRRTCGITEGDGDGADEFDPTVQWTAYPIDTFDGLGAHEPECL